MRLSHSLQLVVLILAGSVLAAGAGDAAMRPCLPSPLRVNTDRVHAGGAVVMSSAAFACSARYPVGKTYKITLGQVGRGPVVSLASAVPVSRDGAFRTTLHVPSTAAPGESYVVVH